MRNDLYNFHVLSSLSALAAELYYTNHVSALVGPACNYALDPVARMAAPWNWNIPIVTGNSVKLNWRQNKNINITSMLVNYHGQWLFWRELDLVSTQCKCIHVFSAQFSHDAFKCLSSKKIDVIRLKFPPEVGSPGLVPTDDNLYCFRLDHYYEHTRFNQGNTS